MIAVYTVNIPKGYTKLYPPLLVNDEVDYWVVSDAPYDLPPWKSLVVDRDTSVSPRRDFLRYKLQSHVILPKYDHTIYLDACFRLKADPQYLVSLLQETEDTLAMVQHPWRNCLYEEADVVSRRLDVDKAIVDSQVARYRREGYPEQNGLAASTFFIRDNKDPRTCALFDMWLGELEHGCNRSQVAINYCLWKLGLSYRLLDLPWGENVFYGRRPIRRHALSYIRVPGLISVEERHFIRTWVEKTVGELGPDITIINAGRTDASYSLRSGAKKATLYVLHQEPWARLHGVDEDLQVEPHDEDPRAFQGPVHIVLIDGSSYSVLVNDVRDWVVPHVVVGGYVILPHAYYQKSDAMYDEYEHVRLALKDTIFSFHNWRQAERIGSTIVFQRMGE